MKIVVFGLTISSSWGNGHATLWRGLCRALAARGHDVIFFERDVSYYAAHRDAVSPAGCDLRLYSDWESVRGEATRAVRQSSQAIVCGVSDIAALTRAPASGARPSADV